MNRNPFSRLKDLLPEAPLSVGDIVSGSAGAWLVQLPDGAQISVRGNAAVGDRVFVRDGVIEGPAPHLPVVNVEI